MRATRCDGARLREYLRIALACAPLVAGAASAGCSKETKHPPRASADAAGLGAGKVATKAVALETPPDESSVPEGMRTPSCPSGKWCGTVADAKSMQPAQKESEPPRLGCPVRLAGQGDNDGKADTHPKVPKDWPGDGNMYVDMNLDDAATKARQDAGDKSACCYDWYNPCPGGRPLLEGGRAVVAAAHFSTEAVAADPALAHLPPALRKALAEAWLADALAEHASVASFARATLELMAAGAPPELLAGCQRAGLDEIRHAERCFGLAARYAGRQIEPGALPALAPRATADGAVDLARLAVDTFTEGCVGETVAALCATRALAGCQDAAVRTVLAGIVKDERRHAALAWKTIAWTLAEGGAPVAAALAEAARTLRPADVDPPAEMAADVTLLRHGRLDPVAQRAAARDAWADVIAPTLAELTATALAARAERLDA